MRTHIPLKLIIITIIYCSVISAYAKEQCPQYWHDTHSLLNSECNKTNVYDRQIYKPNIVYSSDNKQLQFLYENNIININVFNKYSKVKLTKYEEDVINQLYKSQKHINNKEYKLALNYKISALLICKKHSLETLYYICKLGIADIHIELNNYNKAISAYITLLKNTSKHETDKGRIYNALIFSYYKTRNINMALYYYRKANNSEHIVNLYNKNRNYQGDNNKKISQLFFNILQDSSTALYYIKKAVRIFKKEDKYREVIRSEILKISYEISKNANITAIINNIDKQIQTAKKLRFLKLQAKLELLKARCNSILGNIDLAYAGVINYKKLIINDYNYRLDNEQYNNNNYFKEEEKNIEELRIKTHILQIKLSSNIRKKDILEYILVAIMILISICSILMYRIWRNETIIKHTENKLQETINSKNKFFSIISHDLRSPFNSILGFSNLLKMESKDNCEKKLIKNYTRSIKNSTKNVLLLMNNLIEWANSQQNNISYKAETFTVSKIINYNINLYKPLADNKNISIIKHLEYKDEVFADYNMINTVIRNLINNAIKFTPTSGEIQIICKRKKDKLEIEIRDNGIGISNNDKKKLFNFNSSNNNQSDKGVGLGLMVCKEFIHINKGDIWLHSIPEKGSSFFITIPLFIKK